MFAGPANIFLFHSLYLQMLDAVFRLVVVDKDCDREHLASCIQGSKSIFHVRSASSVVDVKGTRSIGLEERFHDLLGLITA